MGKRYGNWASSTTMDDASCRLTIEETKEEDPTVFSVEVEEEETREEVSQETEGEHSSEELSVKPDLDTEEELNSLSKAELVERALQLGLYEASMNMTKSDLISLVLEEVADAEDS